MRDGEVKMNVGYYPGCSLHATAREYEESLEAIAPELGIQFDSRSTLVEHGRIRRIANVQQ